MSTNLLGVVLVAGFTSYWYYGFRRTLLLARHRREVLSRLRREGPPGNEIPAQGAVHDAVIDMVLDRYRDWRSQPPVTVVAGLPGSGKSVFLAEVVQRLAGSHSWYVPVPLDDVPGGGEQDILDAAQRQLDIILHDASINPGLIESLGRSLARSRRLMIVIDDIDRIGPALSSYERGIVVARLMSSAQQLDVPLLATARSGSVESIAGSVIELPPPSADFLHQRLEQASGIPAELKRLLVPALTGLLATPSMVDRVTGVARRDGERLTTALRCSEANADLVVWRFLLEACQVPGAVLTADGLELVAFVLLITGQREIQIGAGPEWQDALRLGGAGGCGPAGASRWARRDRRVRPWRIPGCGLFTGEPAVPLAGRPGRAGRAVPRPATRQRRRPHPAAGGRGISADGSRSGASPGQCRWFRAGALLPARRAGRE